MPPDSPYIVPLCHKQRRDCKWRSSRDQRSVCELVHARPETSKDPAIAFYIVGLADMIANQSRGPAKDSLTKSLSEPCSVSAEANGRPPLCGSNSTIPDTLMSFAPSQSAKAIAPSPPAPANQVHIGTPYERLIRWRGAGASSETPAFLNLHVSGSDHFTESSSRQAPTKRSTASETSMTSNSDR